MSPIRTALIGLSSSAATSWAASAHLPYLLSPRGRAKYIITALCNSSVEAARQAIATYDLPPTTKAYSDPRSLAEDPDIDFVVCCTRVDLHYDTVIPSVRAGKDVYVEWPLAHDLPHARELAEAARVAGGRTVMGMQGHFVPPVLRATEIIESGRIGKVLSSAFRAAGGTIDRITLSADLVYFTDRSIGGNIFTIGFGHLFDLVQFTVGELRETQPRFHIQRPEVKLRDPSTGTIVGSRTSNVPDLILGTGTFSTSDTVQDGAPLLYRFRRGQPFKNDAALVWDINGEKGELRITAWGGAALNANAYSDPVTMELHDFADDRIETLEWKWEDWQEELPIVARSIGKVYEEFAAGNRVPTFEDARLRHEQLEEMLSTWKA